MSQLNDAQRDIIQQVIKRAVSDREYRATLLSDPNAALAEAGVDTASFPNVRFVENEGAEFTIVLPDPIELVPDLTEEELESVAGGLMAAAKTDSCAKAQMTCCHTHIVVKAQGDIGA